MQAEGEQKISVKTGFLPPRAMMGVQSCGMLLRALHTGSGEEKLNLLMVDNHIPAGAKTY